MASRENKEIIILGDANLCYIKWHNPDIDHMKIAEELQDTKTQCGLVNIELVETYMADRLNKEEQHITSALDHIYIRLGPCFHCSL